MRWACSLTPGPAPAAAGPGQRTTRWGGSRWHCPRGSVATFAPRKQPHGLRVLFPEEPHFPRLQVPHVQQRAAPRRREEPLVCLERAAAVPPTLSVVDISGGGVWLTSGVNIKGAAARVLRISSHIRLLLLGRPLLLLWQCSASLLSFEITMREISPHQSVKNTGCGSEQAPSNVPRPLEIDSSIMLVNILRLGSSLLARIFLQLPRSSQVRQRHQENLVTFVSALC